MRDYGIVSPKFWIGETGKKFRGDPEAQVLALYLMTSPHATMIGIYHCPILYMSHETGIPLEGACKALERLIGAGFCCYDKESETIFVYQMAKYQIGDALKASDKRVLGIKRELKKVPQPFILDKFLEIYGESFSLQCEAEREEKEGQNARGFEAPSKPLPSQDQDQDQDQDQKHKHKYSDEHFAFAEAMAESIRRVIPKFKPPNLQSWANTVRMLNELDNNTMAEISEVFAWANADSFWQQNILSPKKLRSQFAVLHAKSRTKSLRVVGDDLESMAR